MRFLLILIAIIGILFSSCEKAKEYSPVPEIKFVSIEQIRGDDGIGNLVTIVKVRFSFVDGDGDLGLRVSDTLGEFAPGKPNYNNLKFQHYNKTEGKYILDESIKNYFRFQYIAKEETANKVLKGVMEAELIFAYNSAIIYADTSKLFFYIDDRALNKSNIEETPDFFLNQ